MITPPPEEGAPRVEIVGLDPANLGPARAANLPAEVIIDVRLQLPPRARHDQLIEVDLRLVGDGAVELGAQTWIIRIPPL